MPKVEQEPDPRRRVPGIDGVAAGAGDGCVGQAVMLDIAKWNIVQAFEMVFPLQAYKCVKQYLQDPTFFATKVGFTFSAVWCTFTFTFCGIYGFFFFQFVEQRFAAFPAITVCPEDDGYKEEVLKV